MHRLEDNFKVYLKEKGVMCGLDLLDSWQEWVEGSSESGNHHSGSVEGRELPGQ
jgi:hypothetical protein